MKDIKLRISADRRINKTQPQPLNGDITNRDVLFESSIGTFVLVESHDTTNHVYAQVLTVRYYPLKEPVSYYKHYHNGLQYSEAEACRLIFYFQNNFSENSITPWLNPILVNKTLKVSYSKPEYNTFDNDGHIYNYRLDIQIGLNPDNTIQTGHLPEGEILFLGLPKLLIEPARVQTILFSSQPDVYNTIVPNDYYSPQIGIGKTGGRGANGPDQELNSAVGTLPPNTPGSSGLITHEPKSPYQYSNRVGQTGCPGGYGLVP